MNFKDTLKLHLDAMKTKNFDQFMSTVKVDDVTLIMPNGTLITEKEEFVELHKDWFEDQDWAIEYELLSTEESVDIAYALLNINYKDCDADGNKIEMNYYLNLIFRKQNEKWLLIHDQNTVYK